MKKMQIVSIGKIEVTGDATSIVLEKPYFSGFKGLEGFSHVGVPWWFDRYDTPASRPTIILRFPIAT